ncbi:MAG: FKBP-type peptidyl-prolyl cis-trans isomerase [Bacteroidales bacterium]|jgi:FKBP-type peptidyl-prolyl cis-trans isomerase|nr:FKBP-type peptidyl-prolyl cis-trans isomerase [Bacteroidales bacterium]
MKAYFILLMGILTFLSGIVWACQPQAEKKKKVEIENLDEKIINANKLIVRDESKDIALLLQRYGWKMESTGTGMYYAIESKGEGALLQKGDAVDIAYNISLISGKEVYNSKKEGLKTIRIEQSDEPAGLHELLKMMKVGDKAKAIIPSHLAYGILGDNNLIPPYATLIYRIEIINFHINNK